jgi:hypothetical protein
MVHYIFSQRTANGPFSNTVKGYLYRVIQEEIQYFGQVVESDIVRKKYSYHHVSIYE